MGLHDVCSPVEYNLFSLYFSVTNSDASWDGQLLGNLADWMAWRCVALRGLDGTA